MPKGKHRRHRTARELKRRQLPGAANADRPECAECGQVDHADWCRAERSWWVDDDTEDGRDGDTGR